MAEVRIPDLDEKDVDTVLAEDIDFSGVLIFRSPLMIKGKFTGEIKDSGDLYIGERATVKAKIQAELVSSKGKVEGDIAASKRVELASTSTVEGDITTSVIVIENGCKFNGLCNMRGNNAKGSMEGGHHEE